MTPKNELLFLPLGGSGEIGMNVNLYGCQGKWLMVDLGMTFADPAYPGIDLILPDLTFIEERRKDLAGIVLTHGHEDHIGAIPYLAGDLGVPLYATPFTAGLIRGKLEEEGIAGEVELNVIHEETPFDIGPFRISYVPLAHSIPEGNALLIETPYGRIFHTGDWKLDEEPVLGVPSTAAELRAIGDAGVLALVCDSTNVFNPRPSGSEGAVRRGLDEVVGNARGRVLVTTFASNAARLATLAAVAQDTGRKLVVAGRSLDRIIRVAKSVGYLTDFPEPISFEAAMDLPPSQLLIVATGGQGEDRAALSRIAFGQHPLKLSEGDLVIFSSRQIPGNEMAIARIQNRLAGDGIEMITDRQAHVHVSGHPGRPELAEMYRWIRPDIVVPVHGEMRHMMEQARFALSEGVADAVVPENGRCIRLAPGKPGVISYETAGRLIVDGDVILPADGVTMQARRRLANNGYMGVTVVLDGHRLATRSRISIQGLPVEEDRDDFIEDICDRVDQAARAGAGDADDKLREALRLAARRAATNWTGKKPVVDVTLVRL